MKTATVFVAFIIIFASTLLGCSTDICSHDYLGEVITYPSCEEFGEKLYKCTLCGDEYSLVLEELWHTADLDGNCERCGEKIATDEIILDLFIDETFYFVSGVNSAYNHNIDLIIPAYKDNLAVKTIGEDAFLGSYFKSVKIPPTVEFVRRGAFAETYGLRCVVLSRNLKEIGEDAFFGSYIETITVYAGLVEIKPNAFSGCKFLRQINFYGTREEFESIIIAEGNDCFTSATVNFIA